MLRHVDQAKARLHHLRVCREAIQKNSVSTEKFSPLKGNNVHDDNPAKPAHDGHLPQALLQMSNLGFFPQRLGGTLGQQLLQDFLAEVLAHFAAGSCSGLISSKLRSPFLRRGFLCRLCRKRARARNAKLKAKFRGQRAERTQKLQLLHLACLGCFCPLQSLCACLNCKRKRRKELHVRWK